ncbi:MAG TPA: DNA-processing protein DprA [Gemmatimonadales bacterium]|nr:DNA-processing protein DprA [Gemmatimonadales bacterium]
MDDARLAYLALVQVPGLGPTRLQTLLDRFDSPLGAHSAPFAFLSTLPGFSSACATAIKTTSLDDGRRLVADAERVGARILIPDDAEFPAELRTIPDPPPVLFALGDEGLLHRPALAVVGSRDHTPYGQVVTRTVSAQAARAGIVVVSGMARGLDAVAHTAALDAGGATIGVLGNGIGIIYPSANRALYERVAARGLLLTEFPPGERPHAGSFPRRNRLISGLARATLVVEAAVGSGALITAGTALDQGREVLAVPGPITSAVSSGCNRLLRDGASPYLEPADLFTHFAECRFVPEEPAVPGPALRPLPETLTVDERRLAELLGESTLELDRIATRSGKPVGIVLALLCGLELQGLVEQQPGRRFRRL